MTVGVTTDIGGSGVAVKFGGSTLGVPELGRAKHPAKSRLVKPIQIIEFDLVIAQLLAKTLVKQPAVNP
jgi:hypothetical protein